jgi:hypothetical protein
LLLGSGVGVGVVIGDGDATGAWTGAIVMTVVGVRPPDVQAAPASPAASAARAAVRVAFTWCSSREPPRLGGEGSTVVLRLHENFTVELPRP